MDSKSILVGLVAAVAVGSATASSSVNPLSEKQVQAEVMSKLLSNVTPVMYHPECTIKKV